MTVRLQFAPLVLTLDRPTLIFYNFCLVENHLQWELDRLDENSECKISGFKLGLFNSESDKVPSVMSPSVVSDPTRGELVHESKLSNDDRKRDFIFRE